MNQVRIPVWRKSARSFANNECVEIARLNAGEIGLRDSTQSAQHDCPVLSADAESWESFTTVLKRGK